MPNIRTFGSIIAGARRARLLSQKELAARIMKDDGTPISPQYLNDIERDRRNAPSEFLVAQFASQLDLDRDLLCLMAGALPQDLADCISRVEPERVSEEFRVFRKSIQRR